MEDHQDKDGKIVMLLVVLVVLLMMFWFLWRITETDQKYRADTETSTKEIAPTKIGEQAVLAFITNHMTMPDGGMRTNYDEGTGDIPSGGDVLSESQGMIMEYAAAAGNRTLFEHTLAYTQAHRMKEGGIPWVMTEKLDITVNALVDDLRILGALAEAEAGWGSTYELKQELADAVLSNNTWQGNPVDFYDAAAGQKAGRFTLCYGDLKTLYAMTETEKEYVKLYEKTVELIENGYIGEQFPFYYSYYDYEKEAYVDTTLHMAEALTTVLHLAEVGKVKDETLSWLRQRIAEGKISASYETDGSTAAEGDFESTAVYALTAMTALECRDYELAGQAFALMEQFCTKDTAHPLFGAFGTGEQGQIYSFDQGMALLAYRKAEEMDTSWNK